MVGTLEDDSPVKGDVVLLEWTGRVGGPLVMVYGSWKGARISGRPDACQLAYNVWLFQVYKGRSVLEVDGLIS